MTPTHTSRAADLPAIQRYKIGYHSDDWGQRSSTPSGIPDASGSWVRYADHVAALAAGQAVAPVTAIEIESLNAQLHAAKQINAAQFGLLAASIPGSALRASHEQAPAGATDEAEVVCAEAYQVVGVLLNDLGIFGTERAEKILDNLSQAKLVHKDVLPWESTQAPVAQQVDASPSAASIAWNVLRDATDPLGELGARIMGHVRIFAQRQYEAGRDEVRPAPLAMDGARLDSCTDPYNCKRCKAHPNHRSGLDHAGIPAARAAQKEEGKS